MKFAPAIGEQLVEESVKNMATEFKITETEALKKMAEMLTDAQEEETQNVEQFSATYAITNADSKNVAPTHVKFEQIKTQAQGTYYTIQYVFSSAVRKNDIKQFSQKVLQHTEYSGEDSEHLEKNQFGDILFQIDFLPTHGNAAGKFEDALKKLGAPAVGLAPEGFTIAKLKVAHKAEIQNAFDYVTSKVAAAASADSKNTAAAPGSTNAAAKK